MKTFDDLYTELRNKAAAQDPDSGTVHLLSGGVHAVGKKVVEEAAEVWMAAEHEGRDRAADEIAQSAEDRPERSRTMIRRRYPRQGPTAPQGFRPEEEP